MEDETAASVRPQKLFSANKIFALFAGTPFTSYAHFLHCIAACQSSSEVTPAGQRPHNAHLASLQRRPVNCAKA